VPENIRRNNPDKVIIFCVDCAAFCSHNELNLTVYDQIDFAFLSPHKNLGGSESCGVLVARKATMNNDKKQRPVFPGGGTVKFVKGYGKEDVMYEPDIFAREIVGTPPYLGFYRAALSFELLKDVIGYDFIHERERTNT
jgi:selenocysteine lyase/cysteine desulfurase